MESSKLLLRRAGAECHKNHASQRLQGAFLNLLAAQPCLSTFLSCLFTTQEHKWRHGVRQHLSAFRSFQTEYFIRSIYSLSAVSLLMQLNLGEHPAGPEPLAVEINMQFNFPHCDEVYWSRGENSNYALSPNTLCSSTDVKKFPRPLTIHPLQVVPFNQAKYLLSHYNQRKKKVRNKNRKLS